MGLDKKSRSSQFGIFSKLDGLSSLEKLAPLEEWRLTSTSTCLYLSMGHVISSIKLDLLR
jgi:hypothetical protein